MKEVFIGKEHCCEGGAAFHSIIKEKDQKLNKKTSFPTESKEHHQNPKRTENITYMIGFNP